MKFETRHNQVLAFALLTFIGIPALLGGIDTAYAEDEHGHGNEAESVSLTPAEMEEFGIQVALAGPGTLSQVRTLPGEVQINQNHLAHLVPRYSGIVTKVLVNIGDTVQRGDTLAIVESNDSLAPYSLTTLIDGTVVRKHMTLGEPVDRDDAGFVIADLSSVWIDITVYQRDLGLIGVGDKVTVKAGTGDQTIQGKISYITPLLDERTRTATARLVVENNDGQWRPGMFITADVEIETADVDVIVPSTAVHTYEEHSVVFVASEMGFEPVPVTVGRRNETHLEITSGLSKGQRYVSVGGFTLKSELAKDSLDNGHSH